MTREEMRFEQQMEKQEVTGTDPHSPYTNPPSDGSLTHQSFQAFSDCEARVQRSPHMAKRLAISSNARRHSATEFRSAGGDVSGDVALAGRTVYNPGDHVPARFEEAFEQHVHILPDCGWITIPSTDLFGKRERKGVD